MRKIPLILLCLLLPIGHLIAQVAAVQLSGQVRDAATLQPMPYANVLLKRAADSTFVGGTITDEKGRFAIGGVRPASYIIQFSYLGYSPLFRPIYVGSLSENLELGEAAMVPNIAAQAETVVEAKQETVAETMDKKSFAVGDNIAQTGGSVLQAMQNLPGVTVTDGKLQLRGSDKVVVLVDGKQTALTGFGAATGLDNIPASAIEKIEIINNPSAKYDANGNAGIVNIIYKKNKQEGFNGRAGLALGAGALWEKKANLPTIRPQYRITPKVNPSLALNYKRRRSNFYFQGDYLYNPTLNKNEFVTRTYADGTIIKQQTKRNRETKVATAKTGLDYSIDESNLLNISALLSTERIIDRGDEPFFNQNLSERLRLWQFLEDELKTTLTASTALQHKFSQPGRQITFSLNYTFHREDEKYNFTNTLPSFVGYDAFKLLSDEHVADILVDYTRPLRYGRLEAGFKYRQRIIPTNMRFFPGLNSPLDVDAGGKATYREQIPAAYGNYIYENKRLQLEAGLRIEYVQLHYDVDIRHPTYKSDGYTYAQPFPSVRAGYKLNEDNKLSFFANRRVDRPNEVDIRVFPKYDDAEIVKVGNPALKPQFTNVYELAFKSNFGKGYFYSALYHRSAQGTITRMASVAPGSNIIYSIMQNAGRSAVTGLELLYSQELSPIFSYNINLNGYQNTISAFSVINKYPIENTFSAAKESLLSGNAKLNLFANLPSGWAVQATAIYLAPDLVPQGQIAQRFGLDMGLKKKLQAGRGELTINATDLLNTMVTGKTIRGGAFAYTSTDYYETQAIRLGYTYKF